MTVSASVAKEVTVAAKLGRFDVRGDSRALAGSYPFEAGLETVTGGEIKIGGKNVVGMIPRERDVAMVFQNYALFPHMNVFGNMSFGMRLRKVPREKIERRVREAASILGIEHLLARKPKELSGGERQRVALGRAIVREPQVFLMDEPLSNIDAKLRVEMRAEIIKLQRRLGVTVE